MTADAHDLPDATRLAVDRTRLAADRTLLAWIRTATSLISFGFTIYKFFQYLRESTPTHPRSFWPKGIRAGHDQHRGDRIAAGHGGASPQHGGAPCAIRHSQRPLLARYRPRGADFVFRHPGTGRRDLPSVIEGRRTHPWPIWTSSSAPERSASRTETGSSTTTTSCSRHRCSRAVPRVVQGVPAAPEARLLLHRLGASTDAGGRQRRRTLNIEPSGGWPIGDPARQEHGLRSITGRTVNASNPRSPTR
jgi:Domain of unknown function (DUF202)